VQFRNRILVIGMAAGLSLAAAGQHPNFTGTSGKTSAKTAPTIRKKLTPQQKFVLDTVKLAVSLPQPDLQDRLRVLASAANVVSSVDRKMAKNLWHEGVRIEIELVQMGKTPAVSVMSSGQADCSSAQSFVENLPETDVVAAEQSLIGALTTCQKWTLDIVARRLAAALEKKIIAPRALMATAESMGVKSPWSQSHFEKMFSSLPNATDNAGEAQNFAAMYARMATEVEKSTARKSGLELLEWLEKLDDTPLRALSVNIASGAMRQALGEEGFQDALNSNIVASLVVRNVKNSGERGRVERPPMESVSVLEAMKNNGADQSERLRGLPASERARQAAAHGFAAGTSGDQQQAAKYFDMAFAAADEVWDARTPEQNTAALVEEVSEAAAQVDSVKALTRAQQLRDPSAQAIAMLAVARVVSSIGVVQR
jgi:hypothetical protein